MKKLISILSFLVIAAMARSQTTTVFQAPTTASSSCRDFASVCGCNGWCNACQHSGKDYCGSTTDNILAAGSGKVVYASNAADGSSGPGDNRGLGRTVVIAHKMAGGTNVYSLYAHLNSISSDIVAGKFVTRGYLIGKKGKSGGGAGDNIHLHFEIKNHSGLGHNPDCSGPGCVGYVRSDLLPVTSRGYFNPNSYIGSQQYLDIAVNSSLPSSISKSGVNLNLTINSPMVDNITMDIRLALYNSSNTYLGDIQAYSSKMLVSGNNTINFSKASLTSPVGSAYKLQVDYRVAGSTGAWVAMPAIAPHINPKNISVTL